MLGAGAGQRSKSAAPNGSSASSTRSKPSGRSSAPPIGSRAADSPSSLAGPRLALRASAHSVHAPCRLVQWQTPLASAADVASMQKVTEAPLFVKVQHLLLVASEQSAEVWQICVFEVSLQLPMCVVQFASSEPVSYTHLTLPTILRV